MLTESKHKWKKLLQYYLLCNGCNKNDVNKIYNTNNSSCNNNTTAKQNEQEIVEKSKLTLDV